MGVFDFREGGGGGINITGRGLIPCHRSYKETSGMGSPGADSCLLDLLSGSYIPTKYLRRVVPKIRVPFWYPQIL